MSLFFDQVTNDWGELTYVPNSLGQGLIAVLVLVFLALAVFIIRKSGKKAAKESKIELTTTQLAFCSMALALGTVLSNIKLFRFPTGGSITLLSMLVIALPGLFFGLVPGILTGIAYGFLQMLIDPYILYPMQLVVDYILAFGALGLSGLFVNCKKNALIKGYIAAIVGRFIFAVISGWIFFGEYAWEGWGAFSYSLAYNAIYIFSEAVLTVIVLMIPGVSKAIKQIKNSVNTAER